MPHKKPSAKDAAPQSHQLEAVRKLARQGDLAQAQNRLAALRRSFPGFKPLHGLAWEVEDLAGSDILAAARALDWLTASPKSRAAAEALRDSALSAGLAALALQTARRIHELDGETLTPVEPLPTPFGPMDLQQAAAVDLSRMHMADGRHEAVTAVLKDVEHAAARNNLALSLFSLGRIDEAVASVDANWQAQPGNLFALERLVRWRCWQQGLGAVSGFAAALRHTAVERAEDAIGRLDGLLFLREWQAADAVWREASDADYWSGATGLQCAQFDYHGACAAVRLGDAASAQRRANMALRGDSTHADTLDLLDQLDDGIEAANDLVIGESGLWLPAAWVDRLKAVPRTEGAASEAALHAALDACDAHADYLGLAIELGGEVPRELAFLMLKRRAKHGDAAALGELLALLQRPCGPDDVRMRIERFLAEEGLRERKTPATVWLQGRLREIMSYGIEISGEALPNPFPPDGVALDLQMRAAIAADDLNQALTLAQRLLERYPEIPMAYAHVAAVKISLGHPAHEVEALYRQAHTIDADYLFARCGLAQCLLERGEVEAGQALLANVLDRESMHPSEYRVVLRAQRVLAHALGDERAEKALQHNIDDFERQFGRGSSGD